MLLRFFLLGPAHECLQRLGRLGHGHFRLIVIRAELEICVDCRVPFVGRFEDPELISPQTRRRASSFLQNSSRVQAAFSSARATQTVRLF